ncbi:MAG TPA: MEDS domain-containing protein [Pseudonocardia sp.]|nr:MEDS domain-containing protein [Pseudonocardia sp.]
MVQADGKLTFVDHACAVADSDEHLWEVTAGWLAGGLDNGERVLYFEDETAAAVLGRLADDRVPVRGAIADGQLVVVPTETTRQILTGPTDQLERLLIGHIDDSTARGWPRLRFTGDTSSALLPSGGAERVKAFERVSQRVLGSHPSMRLLCRYDRRRWNETAIDELRRMHNTELVSPAAYDDNLLRITRNGQGAARLAGEIDHSNRLRIKTLLDTMLDQALRSHSAPTDIALDLSSLRFLDVRGAVSIVHAAEEFPSTHRLRLTGVRPRVLRLLDRCGAPFAAQLVVEPHPERSSSLVLPEPVAATR